MIKETAPMSYIDLEQAKVPGPGGYDEFRYNQTPKWSMRPKTSTDCNLLCYSVFPKTTVLDNPPPSRYNNTEEIGKNNKGTYHLSRYRNSKAKVWNPPRSQRFNKSFTDAPGPGVYKPKNQLSNEGVYVLSRNVSNGKRTFMEGRRQSFIDLKVKK